MDYIKLVGAVLVVLAGAGFGACPVHKMTCRAKEMEELYFLLLRLKSEINHVVKTLPEALKSTAASVKGKDAGSYRRAMERIAARMEEGKTEYTVLLRDVTEEVFQDSVLTAEEADAFLQTFLLLGGADREKQVHALDYYAETVRLAITEEKQKKKEKAYLYRSLGLLGGIFLSVILY
ncbi:MAG: stage III sporulation protein AB [Lachnospiraceae bacterium]|nr:stage III sporulation protein AB [Lachnospiraceae bacterium]